MIAEDTRTTGMGIAAESKKIDMDVGIAIMSGGAGEGRIVGAGAGVRQEGMEGGREGNRSEGAGMRSRTSEGQTRDRMTMIEVIVPISEPKPL